MKNKWPVKIPHCTNCEVKNKSIFCNIDKLYLEQIAAIKGESFFKKGQVIYYEGNAPLGVYVVHNGKVKLTKIGPVGKEQIIGFTKTSGVFGYSDLLGRVPHNTSAVAVEDSVICIIPKSAIEQLIMEDSDFVRSLLHIGYKTMGDLTNTIIKIGQLPVRERLASVLLELVSYFGYKPNSNILDLELTREEYANLIASTKESCMRTFSDFKKEELIDLRAREILVKNMDGLKNLANMY